MSQHMTRIRYAHIIIFCVTVRKIVRIISIFIRDADSTIVTVIVF